VNPRTQFLVSAGLFHAGVIYESILALRRMTRSPKELPGAEWRVIARSAARWLVMVVLLAGLCSLVGPRSGFTVIRLVSQALFAEGIGLSLALAVAQRRGAGLARLAYALVGVVLLAAYVEGYHHGPTNLQVRRHRLDLAQGAGHGTLRLLHLSDLQAEQIGPFERRVLEEARRLEPELVVWTGDFIQPRLSPTRAGATKELRALLRERPIPAPLGNFAVRGDIDLEWPDVVRDTGITPLSGEVARIELPHGRRLSLVGLHPGTSRGHDRAGLRRELAAATPGDLRIVIGHNPNFVRQLDESGGADLALAGHTHGGQVVLPLLGAPYTKTTLPSRYASGLHDYGESRLHVSAGIGMERGAAPQVRFLCPPEICLLEIRY
jgi:predicted MPP superfamily phosphohydrolase